MPRLGLTERQTAVLRYLQGESERGAPTPTLEQIGQAIGVKTRSGVHRLLTHLERRGHVVRSFYAPRSVAIKPADPVPRPIEPVSEAKHPPSDRAKTQTTRRARTYVIELERDLHAGLRRLSRQSGLPPERIIADALRAYMKEPGG